MSRLNQRISLSFLFLCALWFGVMDGAIVGSPEFNQNPIIEGNALIVTCTTNSVGTPDIELQVNGQAATGFSSSVSGQTVNFTMESVSRSLQGGQIRCMDRSDSTLSGVVILIVYYAPQVSVSQSVFDVVTGESVSIGYSITEGNPANSNFSVFWNGAFINPVQYERNATYITFDDISSNFRGNYVIRVSNVAGSGEATFVFNEKSGAERSATVSAILLITMMTTLLFLLSY